MLLLIGICNFGVLIFIIMYIPSLVQNMGYTGAAAHFMTAPPYVIAFLFCLLGGYSSSHQKQFSLHVAVSLAICLLGFILLFALFNQSNIAHFVSTCIAICGASAVCPLILSWLANNVGGHTKRATAVGFIVCVRQIGGIIAPQVRLFVAIICIDADDFLSQIYHDDDKPIYRRGQLICSALLIVSLIVTFILRYSLKLENQRRDHLSTDQHDREAAIKEPCDWVS